MVEFRCDFDLQGVESRGLQGPVPARRELPANGGYLTLASALACSPMLSTQATVMVSPLLAPVTSAER